jgi:hypothetical protein
VKRRKKKQAKELRFREVFSNQHAEFDYMLHRPREDALGLTEFIVTVYVLLIYTLTYAT